MKCSTILFVGECFITGDITNRQQRPVELYNPRLAWYMSRLKNLLNTEGGKLFL